MLSLRTIGAALCACLLGARPAHAQDVLQFLFTSDVHYGITRSNFRGARDVDARVVNQALVARMNAMPRVTLPQDGGVHAGQAVGPIDLVLVAGDIANRAEHGAPPATASWAEFVRDYVHGLTLTDHAGAPAALLVVPGNHDVSNAIGFPKPLTPGRDAAALAGIYDMMIRPSAPTDPRSFDVWQHPVHVGRTFAGVHFAFPQIWPDSAERAWLATDLDTVAASTPVILVTHDPPAGDPKHFTNPRGSHEISAAAGFENLLRERYRDTSALGPAGTPVDSKAPTTLEQRQFAAFVKAHPNIRAYFHGHNNYNEFYVWHGADGDVALNTFRVDSPMKGKESGKDERRLSFQLVTIERATGRMTVRECLWNAAPDSVVFGATRTVSLR